MPLLPNPFRQNIFNVANVPLTLVAIPEPVAELEAYKPYLTRSGGGGADAPDAKREQRKRKIVALPSVAPVRVSG